ncbi:helicase/secretion neighborhood CpaE-like protein [Nocardioides szechwanensis]|uniref:Helicase/secretion neighborhood CpaE-like protein n=1 Tax=Nocardioides szechwanensis TaxID=1005944 RepID=A0A1H0CE77_9ACTN|nr:septum site-determining protein Ssd [Nocardioides szechwanensis]SDN56214.1 helicase/secretion neighborhood CpaE-like protein [Nocardioides szechwanensis]
MTAPLIVTRDETLLDELLRLAAAAGVTPEVASDSGAALRSWNAAPLVLVGADLADETARLAPARRAAVHIVSWGAVPHEMFRTALAVGAESVTELPRSDTWLTETLTDLGDTAPSRSLVLGVVGGSGGAGATTFACALGQVAARTGHAVVVDCDPLGPGVDRVLGLETHDGFRWDALCQTTGRLSGRALREALPRRGALGVLSWYSGASGSLQAFAVREALSAASRGHDVVVVDLPRSGPPVVEEVMARCDLVLVVVVPTVAGVASAARLAAQLESRPQLRLVVRGSGIDARHLSRATGVPVIAEMTDQRGLAEAIDLGLGPVRSQRGQLGRAAADVLQRVGVMGRAA